MTTYTLTCSGTVCGGVNVLGTIELADDHPAPDQAAWGYLCEACSTAWAQAIAVDVADADKHGRPHAHPQHLAPLGPVRHPTPLKGKPTR